MMTVIAHNFHVCAPYLPNIFYTTNQDFVPIPGRMRLRVSNNHESNDQLQHRIRPERWGIADTYDQKNQNSSVFLQIDVRPENVHEMKQPWASTLCTIRVSQQVVSLPPASKPASHQVSQPASQPVRGYIESIVVVTHPSFESSFEPPSYLYL